MDISAKTSPYAARLTLLRRGLARDALAGMIVPRADEHLGEYVPPSAERLAWLTGFTGSAGFAVVLMDHAVLFTDGRYTTQAAIETDPALWEVRHIVEDPPSAWLGSAAPGARIGYDPMLIAEATRTRFTAAGLTMIALAENPIDTAWTDRPSPPRTPCEPHALAFAGEESAAKRARLGAQLSAAGLDAVVLSDPASIAWLLNVRGRDLEYTPVSLAFAILFADARVALFIADGKVAAETRAWLGSEVTLAPPSALGSALDALHGKRVSVDATRSPVWFGDRLRAAGATVVAESDPCLLPKACKNPTEQEGSRRAHRRDAPALVRFLAWLAREGARGRETECSAAAKLLSLRRELPGFVAESFPAISGAGENAAVIHYRARPASDRPIRANEVYLIDSGAQFPEGTTDITRTIWTGPADPPAELRERFTRVLAGHIALARARFPRGIAGPMLDPIARLALWEVGLDYDHGTGHGIGSFLSVHEGPAGLSPRAAMIPLEPGMILSDEPGLYLPGQYGIRLENLLLVRAAEGVGAKPFLEFETLSFVPFARRLIQPELLSPAARAWLNRYHGRVRDEVSPMLDPRDRNWLQEETAPLA